MEDNTELPDGILARAKKIFQLVNAKDIIRWYDNKKLEWFEQQLKKEKEKQHKKIEKQIMNKASISWNNLKKYDTWTAENNVDMVLVQKNGRWFLVKDKNDPFCNEKE